MSQCSPAASFFSSPRLASSEYSAVHTADALRLLLVYKYGGFYLDLDYVVLNSLSHYNNIVVGNQPWEQVTPTLTSLTLLHYRETVARGKISVTNNAFSFSARHPVLEVAMLHLKEKYDPTCWNCIGPKLITAAVRKHSGARLVQNIPARADVVFVPLHRMMSVRSTQVVKIMFPERPVPFTYWQNRFRRSSAVHFFSKNTFDLKV